jgi:hypothetical protein
MKKWLISLSIVLALLLASVYIFIPNTITISKVSRINCTESGASRYLFEKNKWKNWWPDSANAQAQADSNTVFTYKDYSYRIVSNYLYIINILIEHNSFRENSKMHITSLLGDSAAIIWECTFQASLNPITRVLQYQHAVQVKNNMNDLLNHLQSFLEKRENIYSIRIEQGRIKDTCLVSVKNMFATYPTVATIYSTIKELRDYINKKGVRETNYPMLNITKLDSAHFETRVAIPVNTLIKINGETLFKTMVPGNMLTTEIKGGPYAITQALEQVEKYIDDHHKIRVAIPFESLITERNTETDTLKWITRIYYPIIR